MTEQEFRDLKPGDVFEWTYGEFHSGRSTVVESVDSQSCIVFESEHGYRRVAHVLHAQSMILVSNATPDAGRIEQLTAQLGDANDRIAQLQARLSEAVGYLRPIVECLESWPRDGKRADDEVRCYGMIREFNVTYGHMRAARAFLASLDAGENKEGGDYMAKLADALTPPCSVCGSKNKASIICASEPGDADHPIPVCAKFLVDHWRKREEDREHLATAIRLLQPLADELYDDTEDSTRRCGDRDALDVCGLTYLHARNAAQFIAAMAGNDATSCACGGACGPASAEEAPDTTEGANGAPAGAEDGGEFVVSRNVDGRWAVHRRGEPVCYHFGTYAGRELARSRLCEAYDPVGVIAAWVPCSREEAANRFIAGGDPFCLQGASETPATDDGANGAPAGSDGQTELSGTVDGDQAIILDWDYGIDQLAIGRNPNTGAVAVFCESNTDRMPNGTHDLTQEQMELVRRLCDEALGGSENGDPGGDDPNVEYLPSHKLFVVMPHGHHVEQKGDTIYSVPNEAHAGAEFDFAPDYPKGHWCDECRAGTSAHSRKLPDGRHLCQEHFAEWAEVELAKARKERDEARRERDEAKRDALDLGEERARLEDAVFDLCLGRQYTDQAVRVVQVLRDRAEKYGDTFGSFEPSVALRVIAGEIAAKALRIIKGDGSADVDQFLDIAGYGILGMVRLEQEGGE